MDIRELNLALCAALGVPNTDDVTEVTLTIQPMDLPRLVVKRGLRNGDSAKTITETLSLHALPDVGRCPTCGEPEINVTRLGDLAQRFAPGCDCKG